VLSHTALSFKLFLAKKNTILGIVQKKLPFERSHFQLPEDIQSNAKTVLKGLQENDLQQA
jgi:hypothetical protein